MLLAFAANFFLLEKLIIPDPCIYHTRETTALFDMFYSLKAEEGYHPFPTTLNFIITLASGGIAGFLFALKTRKQAGTTAHI